MNNEAVFESSSQNFTLQYNVGDIIKLGNYKQTEDGDIKEIEWVIFSIDQENNKMILVSKYTLDYISTYNMVLHSRTEIIDDENIFLKHWLNNDFYNKAFTEDEQRKIDHVFVLFSPDKEYGLDYTSSLSAFSKLGSYTDYVDSYYMMDNHPLEYSVYYSYTKQNRISKIYAYSINHKTSKINWKCVNLDKRLLIRPAIQVKYNQEYKKG